MSIAPNEVFALSRAYHISLCSHALDLRDVVEHCLTNIEVFSVT